MTEIARPGRPRVTGATFLQRVAGQGPVHVQVEGEDFLARAVPLRARLGEQAVKRIAIRDGGRGFAGLVEQVPRDGDRLLVGYADEDLASTSVVYRASPERIA